MLVRLGGEYVRDLTVLEHIAESVRAKQKRIARLHREHPRYIDLDLWLRSHGPQYYVLIVMVAGLRHSNDAVLDHLHDLRMIERQHLELLPTRPIQPGVPDVRRECLFTQDHKRDERRP